MAYTGKRIKLAVCRFVIFTTRANKFKAMITFKIKLTNENTPFDVDTYLNLMEMDELSHEMKITKEDLLRSLISSGRDGEVLWLVARLLAHYRDVNNDIVKLKLREIKNLI